MTGQELAKLAKTPGIWKRLSELKRRGLICSLAKRPCKVTGRLSAVWQTSSAEPIPVQKLRTWWVALPPDDLMPSLINPKRELVESFISHMGSESYEIIKVRECKDNG